MPYIGCSENMTGLNQHCQSATVIWRAYFQNENKTVSTFSKSSFFLWSLRTSAFFFLHASSNFWKYHASYTALDSISRSTRSRTTHLSVHSALNILYYCYNHYKTFYTPSETIVCVFPFLCRATVLDIQIIKPQWLRCCATNWKVAGSIPAGVNGIFHWHKILPIALWPWGRLSLEQKWVPGVFPCGKGGRCVRLTTLQQSWVIVT